MSWISYLYPCLRPSIAKDDIVVYKIMRTTRQESIITEYFGYPSVKYSYNTLYNGGRLPDYCYAENKIDDGFLSYGETCRIGTSLFSIVVKKPENYPGIKFTPIIGDYQSPINYPAIIIKCIIPKGTKYYVNECNLLISESIFITSSAIPINSQFISLLFDKTACEHRMPTFSDLKL